VKRPFGVVVIGILALISAVVRILGGLALLGIGGAALAASADGGTTVTTVGVVALVIGVLTLIFAIAFLGLRRWAWWAMLFVELAAIAQVVVQMVTDGYVWTSLVGIIIPALIVLYLMSGKVRRAFFGRTA
jgi:hypothetical protein